MTSKRVDMPGAGNASVCEIRPGALKQPPVRQPDLGHPTQSSTLQLVGSNVVRPNFERPEPPEDVIGQTQPEEHYGRSLRAMRMAGNVALNGAEIELDPNIKQLKAEFDSAIGEMFKTAPGIGEHLTMERNEQFDVIDGQVVDESGESLEVIISRGVLRSEEIALSSQPAMAIQAERDQADLDLLKQFIEPMFKPSKFDHPARRLSRGYNTVFAVSAYPEDGVEQYGQQFWKELGYNTERRCAMLQMYHRSPDGKLLTRSLSIDNSSMPKLVSLLRHYGASVPDDCSVSDLLTHPITESMTYGMAVSFMDEFVAEYEQSAGLPPKQATTENLLHRHSSLIERSFKDLYLEVAKSLADGQKTAKLQEFISSIQPIVHRMSSSHKEQLQFVYDNDLFDEDTARLLHGVILYSVAETVRNAITDALNRSGGNNPGALISPYVFVDTLLPATTSSLVAQIGNNFIRGVEAGREYGGCGALFNFGSLMNRQQVFGGHSRRSDIVEDDPGDGLGPIEFKCKNGHWCRRPFGELLPKCDNCNDDGESVGCQE